MRVPNHYDALKQGQHKNAEQEQQNLTRNESQNSNRHEALKLQGADRTMAEQGQTQNRTMAEQEQTQQGRDSTQHQNSDAEPYFAEPYMSDDDRLAADIVAKGKELQALVKSGKLTWWESRYLLSKYEPSLHTAEQQAAKTNTQRGGQEMTDAKQQQEEKMARFRERMNESEQSYSLGRGDEGRER
jgi:phage shock protein A